jgi:hypothetical protein
MQAKLRHGMVSTLSDQQQLTFLTMMISPTLMSIHLHVAHHALHPIEPTPGVPLLLYVLLQLYCLATGEQQPIPAQPCPCLPCSVTGACCIYPI